MTHRPLRGAGLAAILLGLAVLPGRAMFFNGFETDTAGWDVFGGSFDAVRVASGTDGIASSTGAWHGQAGTAATNWGGYSSVWPAFGYSTAVDVYLDVDAGWANDTRFDWTSAINNSAGSHRRDFIFNGGFYDDAGGPGTGNRFVFSASNNAGRTNSYPKNPGRDPIAIDQTGWYTFQHDFYDNGGVLAVDLTIAAAGGPTIHSWTLSDPSDLVGILGGNRYGWFANNEFPYLAIDNSRLDLAASAVPEPGTLLLLGGGLALVARRRKR